MYFELDQLKESEAIQIAKMDAKYSEFPYTRDEWFQIAESDCCMLVLRAYGDIVAFVIYETLEDEVSIHRLVSKPIDMAKESLLTALFVKFFLKGIKSVEVFVPEDSARGDQYDEAGFYKDHGFEAVEVIKGAYVAYGKTADTFLMRKIINDDTNSETPVEQSDVETGRGESIRPRPSDDFGEDDRTD